MTNTSSPTRGILLIALGASEYGCMAANLAASIRYHDSDIGIHLVHTDSSVSMLTDAHRALFSSMQVCPMEYYTRQGARDEGRGAIYMPSNTRPPSQIEFIKAKTHIYDLTPFDETLFLDVDMYILPHIHMSAVMSDLSAACDYTIKNRGYENLNGSYTHWFSVDEARAYYSTEGRFYQSQSEFIFFKRTKRNDALFANVREVFDTRPIAGSDFRGSVSDEYAYNIAMALTGTYPHIDGYIPIYWYYLEGQHDWNRKVVKNYIGFSLGGDSIPDWLISKINVYKQLYKTALKLPHLFNVAPKRRWNAKRKAM